MTAPGADLKEAERSYKKQQAQRKMLERLFRKWVPGSEQTPEQHAAVQTNLKADFYARQEARASK